MNEKIKNDCRTLWRNCFGDSETYMDYYFDEKCKDNHILIDVEDDHVVSMVHLNPYQLKWKNKEIKSCYIVGVATEEKFRKQGRMRELLEQSFSNMQGEQIPFTFLMPADKRIYEPFGFKTIYTQERVFLKEIDVIEKIKVDEADSEAAELKAASVSKVESETAAMEMKTFSQLTDQEKIKAIAYCNKKLSKEFDIYAIRDEKYYTRLQKEMEASCGSVVVFIKNDCENLQQENSEIAGIVSFGLENGYIEVTEALIETELTQDVVKLLLQRIEAKDKSKVYFYESYFLDKAELAGMAGELETISKDIIMAKVLGDNMSFSKAFEGQKVYLNEIV